MKMSSIEYKAGYKYQLVKDCVGQLPFTIPKRIDFLFFQIEENGQFIIFKGYAWDGPSGPTCDTKNFMRGSLVHDVLYQAIRLGLLPPYFRLLADKVLKEICLQDGMNRIRVEYVYNCVRIGASSSASPKNERKVLSAP